MSNIRNLKHEVCSVIVSYNGGDVIGSAVHALIGQVADLVIIDNASNDETKKELRRLESKKIKVIYNAENTGVAHALNQGVSYAQAHGFDWVLTMDQDSIAEPDMVRKLMDCASSIGDQSNAVSFSPVIICGNDKSEANENVDFINRYTVITSGNLLRIDIFKKIGLFEEKLFIDSVDFEYCLRIKKYGYKIIRCFRAALHHSLGSTEYLEVCGMKIFFTLHPPFRKYYIMRNHIYITKRYMLIFPMYCLWKQVAIIRLILQIVFVEKNKCSSLEYLCKGLYAGLVGNYKTLCI